MLSPSPRPLQREFVKKKTLGLLNNILQSNDKIERKRESERKGKKKIDS